MEYRARLVGAACFGECVAAPLSALASGQYGRRPAVARRPDALGVAPRVAALIDPGLQRLPFHRAIQ